MEVNDGCPHPSRLLNQTLVRKTICSLCSLWVLGLLPNGFTPAGSTGHRGVPRWYHPCDVDQLGRETELSEVEC